MGCAIGETGFLRQFGHPQAGERCLFGRLHHDRATGSERRAPLPSRHQHREIPGNDLSGHPDRFAAGIDEEITPDRNRFAVDLVGPTGVVPQTVNDQGKIGGGGIGKWFSVIERFERCQSFEILFDQIGQFVHQCASIARIHLSPRTLIQRRARGFGGQINIGCIAFGDFTDNFFCGWIHRGKGFTTDGGCPLAPDKTLGFSDRRGSDRFT
jgi:hypothetical protein